MFMNRKKTICRHSEASGHLSKALKSSQKEGKDNRMAEFSTTEHDILKCLQKF